MAVASTSEMSLALGDSPRDASGWSKILFDALADGERHAGFLPLAEKAVGACPGDALILYVAATAALLVENAEQALIILKRFRRRYVAEGEDRDTSSLL